MKPACWRATAAAAGPGAVAELATPRCGQVAAALHATVGETPGTIAVPLPPEGREAK